MDEVFRLKRDSSAGLVLRRVVGFHVCALRNVLMDERYKTNRVAGSRAL